MINEVEIKSLFDKMSETETVHKTGNDYEVIDCSGLGYEIMVSADKYVPLKFISRHLTTKHLIKISISSFLGKHILTTTTDHVCMIFNRNHMFEQKSSKDLNEKDMVMIYDEESNSNLYGVVDKIEDLGTTTDYVYDCEVEDEQHCFNANGVMIHNSQFANIQCVTEYFIKRFNLPKKMMEWPDEYKLKLWKFMDKFVEETVNPFVQNLVKEHCYSEHPEVLRYSLEYIGDNGIYEQKKRYCVHKVISEGPELCDKLKYTGIELKRSNVAPEIKEFLKEIYESTILKDWTNSDYLSYIKQAYDKFCKMSVNEISFWKGWNSDKIESEGFLKGGKGMTGISKACHFYNELIDHLKIGKKYDTLKLGDKVRLCYIQNNMYNIDVIAFPNGAWPEEFNSIFTVDYATMFTKSILDPLKSFRAASHFEDFNPSSAVMDDIFSF